MIKMERKKQSTGAMPPSGKEDLSIEAGQMISKIEKLLLFYEDHETLKEFHNLFIERGTSGENKTFKLSGFRFELPDEKLNLKDLEKEIVKRVLKKFNGNKSKTAEYLCISRSALRSKL